MKQAIVLIHGIGEQVPMDTLRGFVEAVWTNDEKIRRPTVPAQPWSKPEEASGSFELRRLTTAENVDGKRTDFFEFYWAHLMEGTTLSHLGAWVRLLILRPNSQVPKQLKLLWWLVVAAIGAGCLLLAIELTGRSIVGPEYKRVIWGTWSVVSAVACGFLVKVAGDAARYLHVAPPNIQIRHRIREAGIKLLENLHRSGKYDRIVVVGHSLGSVIGYDVLTHLWARWHDQFTVPSNHQPQLEAIEELGRNAVEGEAFARRYQAAQSAYFKEIREAGHPWLISDFVTLGSPLAHAPFLMARGTEAFKAKLEQREFPTCPPVLESFTQPAADSGKGNSKIKRFSYEAGFGPTRMRVPHHAAPFGPTRWTNIFFPCSYTVYGDVIAGPVASVFGNGVLDISTQTTLHGGCFSHTSYWSLPGAWQVGDPIPEWIDKLRHAVRLGSVYEA